VVVVSRLKGFVVVGNEQIAARLLAISNVRSAQKDYNNISILEQSSHSHVFPDKEKSAPNRGAYLGGARSFGQ
jgi:hypothetical protein